MVALLCGCASYTKQTEQFKAQWIAGNTEVAAQIATDEAESRADSRDAIVWRLEQGAALRADGKPMESNVAFDEAEPKIKYYREDAARVRASKEAVSAVTNLAAVPYEGYGYDRVMLHTYKALNYLQLGEKDAARVEFKRAENAQKNELERNAKRLEAAREAKQNSILSNVSPDAKIQDELTDLEPRIDEEKDLETSRVVDGTTRLCGTSAKNGSVWGVNIYESPRMAEVFDLASGFYASG